MTNEILQKRKLEIDILKENLKDLKKRERWIKQLGFSELVPTEYFSLTPREFDEKVNAFYHDGKINHDKYASYFFKKNNSKDYFLSQLYRTLFN
jgi:hypothetical protein